MSTENKVEIDPKVIGIIAYLTLIGWIVALILNSSAKSEFGSFHIRQALGIGLLGLLLAFIPVIGWILTIILVIIGLMSAINGEQKTVPVVGEYFQEWFRGL